VWDLDGREYVDMSSCAVGACILGFADPDVNAAVVTAIQAGSASTLNCPEELELAELLCQLHPWADMVRYARGGGEAMAIAVRISRACTGRDKITFCGYHGWHDWYLAANLRGEDPLSQHFLTGFDPVGVPRCLEGTAHPFGYNAIEELREVVARYGEELAAIVMEPVRNFAPADGFLEEVRDIATRNGSVLIFDEVTSGWRMNTGGIHALLNVTPDLAVFAKAIGNGYPMAAIIGIRDVMQAAQDTFISSTSWTERIGPAAALATITKHRDHKVGDRLVETGNRIQAAWRSCAKSSGLPVEITGIPPLAHFSIEEEKGQAMRTLFTQEMLERGFLASNLFYATYAHDEDQIERYERAVGEVFCFISEANRKGEVEKFLKGPVAHSGFYRLT